MADVASWGKNTQSDNDCRFTPSTDAAAAAATLRANWQLLVPAHHASSNANAFRYTHTHTHTHPFNGPFPGLPGWAGTRKVKPIWILLKQETVSCSGISWAICKSARRSRQITIPAPHHSSFFTGRMPFLPPNQQRQSTEGIIHRYTNYTFLLNV